MFQRDNGQILLQEYAGYGGNRFDSTSLTNFFNYDQAHSFGVMVSKVFTSNHRFKEKPLTALTNAVGNYYAINSQIYKWELIGDDERLFTIRGVVTSQTRPGFGGEPFDILLDEGWMREPDIIMGEDNRYMLRIIGDPIQEGANWRYKVELQDGDPNSYIPLSEISLGRTFVKASTSVVGENNRKFGTGQWGSAFQLQSQLGYYAEEFSVSDRVVREEIYRRKGGVSSEKDTPNMSGMVFSIKQNDKPVQGGAFLTFQEMDLRERLEMDREIMCVFGKLSTKLDQTENYIRRTGPGFRQLVLDGHEYYHNGSLTAQQLEDYLMAIFLTRKDEADRDTVIDTGTLGSRMLDQLLSAEASAFLTVDSHYIRQMGGGENWELEYGAQFKHFVAKNGVKVRLKMNPMKDDPKFCRRFYPDNVNYTIDSARMDIYDLGKSASSEAKGGSNMSMVKQNLMDEYYWICGVVDPSTGIINNGAKASNPSKEVTCRQGTSGSVCVWDTKRIGSIIYEPDYL